MSVLNGMDSTIFSLLRLQFCVTKVAYTVKDCSWVTLFLTPTKTEEPIEVEISWQSFDLM